MIQKMRMICGTLFNMFFNGIVPSVPRQRYTHVNAAARRAEASGRIRARGLLQLGRRKHRGDGGDDGDFDDDGDSCSVSFQFGQIVCADDDDDDDED